MNSYLQGIYWGIVVLDCLVGALIGGLIWLWRNRD